MGPNKREPQRRSKSVGCDSRFLLPFKRPTQVGVGTVFGLARPVTPTITRMALNGNTFLTVFYEQNQLLRIAISTVHLILYLGFLFLSE